jgi:hypothetical protein
MSLHNGIKDKIYIPISICEKMQTKTYLLDTCFTQKRGANITRRLFKGPQGLAEIDETAIYVSIERINYLYDLISDESLSVIEEVRIEMKEHLRILNSQTSYIIRKLKSKKSRRKKFKRNETSELLKDHSDMESFTNIYYKFLSTIKNLDIRDNFSKKQKDIYQNGLSMAKAFSKDLDEKSLNNKNKLISPINLGAQLETDKKIAATAYTVSHENPAYILTSDRGLEKLLSRMGERIEIGGTRTIPHFPISCIYPSQEEKLGSKVLYLPRIKEK